MTIRLRRWRGFLAVLVLASMTLAAPTSIAVASSSPFTDIEGSVFKADIEWLHARGITGGCTSSKYCPDATVTREQMASFIARLLALPATSTDYFSDDEASVHQADINRLAAAGVTGGCTATSFCPRSVVTRAQMSSFIARAAHLTEGAGRNYFFDDNGNPHEPDIDRAAAAGITGGCAEWRYCPSGTVSRGQMAAFLRRVIHPVDSPPYPAPDPEHTMTQLLSLLSTAPEVRAGYDRSLFRHWIDADGDGCNTRYEVLIAEAVVAPAVGGGCRLTGGSWFSAYDGLTFTNPSGLDIDHMVPLAEAWDSGARNWSPARREAFANDLGVSWSLIAVSASTNRSKSDRDPAEWLPPRASYHCTYAADWLAVKVRWSLTVDSAERAALHNLAAGCPSMRRLVVLAP